MDRNEQNLKIGIEKKKSINRGKKHTKSTDRERNKQNI